MRTRWISVIAAAFVATCAAYSDGQDKPANRPSANDDETCINAPTGQLCSLVPHDVVEELGFGYSSLAERTERDFDVFSWQSFVALNWPANANGTPSAASILDDSRSRRVWEFYKTPFDVFPALARPAFVKAELQRFAASGKHLRVFQLIAKGGLLKPGSFLEAFVDLPLIDRNLNFVLYDLAMNDVEAKYILDNGLQTIAGQRAFQQAGKTIGFPLGYYTDNNLKTGGSVGALEIKTSWRILEPSKGDKLDRYFTREASVYIDAAHTDTGKELSFKATLGLVGMHIVQRTKGSPQSFQQNWIWSTFEHVDNAPLADNAREQFDLTLPMPLQPIAPNQVAKSYAFFNPKFHGVPNTPPTKLPGQVEFTWNPQPPYAKKYAFQGKYGTQVVQCWKIFSGTQAVNKQFQNHLKGTVWENYQLIGSQWSSGNTEGAPPPANGDVPRFLSNTTLETSYQFDGGRGSCLSCHGIARTNVTGQDANFSFLLQHAK